MITCLHKEERKMNELKIHFENCYGIKKLEHTFNFSQSKVQIIYAPNGAMKSSFAKTLEDISLEEKSKDRIFSERVNHRSALVDMTPAEKSRHP